MVVDTEFNNDPRVRNEASILTNAGYRVFILCMNYGEYEDNEKVDQAVVQRIRISRNKKNRLFGMMNSFPLYTNLWVNHLKKFVRKNSIDVLHVHDLHMMDPVVKANLDMPVVLDLHENLPAVFETAFTWAQKIPKKWLIQPHKWRLKEGKLLQQANKIIVLDSTFADQLCEKYLDLNPASFVEYPNVPDIDNLKNYPISTVEEINSSDFVLFYFGVIAERRGVFEVMEVIPDLVREIPNLKLLLIGPCDNSDKQRFSSLINSEIIKNHVIYIEWKEIKEFPSYCTASDIGVSPIKKDEQHESGIANKVFQYMLFEKPVLVSDCLPQKNLVEKYHCGLSYKWGDEDDLKAKVLYLFHNKKERKQMGMRGLEAVKEKYNTNFMGERLVKMYNELMASTLKG